jgi:SAM-dependent methyltransferase
MLSKISKILKINSGQPKLAVLKSISNERFKLLDIGCGNNSCKYIKSVFPYCYYAGVDKYDGYNTDQESIMLQDAFYKIDLEHDGLHEIPDNNFDVVLVVHVIEHLLKGNDIIQAAVKKLKPGGIIYIEWPHERSISFPSMRDTLNFFDDDTHVRIWSMQEVCNILLKAGLKIQKAGTRRNWRYILLSIILIPYRSIRRQYVSAADIWDHLGFAQFVIGVKR